MTTPRTTAIAAPPHLHSLHHDSSSNHHSTTLHRSSATNYLLDPTSTPSSSSITNPTHPRLLYHAVNSLRYSSWPRDVAHPEPDTSADDLVSDESATMSRPDLNESFTLSRTDASITALAPDADPHSPKKRRREPDWNEFYRNGLPEEIIIIEDSPEPAADVGHGLINVGAATSPSAAPPPAKRRRKGDAAAPLHVDSAASQATALQSSHPNDANISSARTSGTLNTTAPTSLSSNGQREEAVTSFDHQRTTRRRTAAEAKRKALDRAGALHLTYEPPPKPPKKVSNVHARVVADVSIHPRRLDTRLQ